MQPQIIQHPLSAIFFLFLCLAVQFTGIASLVYPTESATAAALDPARPSTQKTPSRVNATRASLMPATIQNFRVMTNPEKTRLVIDLDRHTKVIAGRAQHPSRIVIALPNTAMSQSARMKVENGTVPSEFVVTQSVAPAVAVVIPATAFRSYKQFTLSNPPRLVVDLSPPIDSRRSSIADAQDALSPAGSPALQPVAPPAKGYRTIVIDPVHGGKDLGVRGLRLT